MRSAFAKNRRECTVSLKPETAAQLRVFLGSKLPTARVFRLPRQEDFVRLLRSDLERAGVTYVDDAEWYADFHSLRATFTTNPIAAGVDLRTAQELLGHSTPTVTLGICAKVLRGSRENAIGRLPRYDRPEWEAGRATGTYDTAPAAGATVAKTAQDRVQKPFNSTRGGSSGTGAGAGRQSGGNPSKIQGNPTHCRVWK